ncbi:hypothetical protein PSGK_20760 [Pseudomonas solani]|uniref:hypothetical protein n=1 Tax=Pseudomonas solani TaxID=2731552 RepID=UPI0035BE239E
MVEVLFFNANSEAGEVADLVFYALGMPFNLKGSSANSLSGEYSSLSVFGLNVKLESNTYDYEDDYEYMISIYKDKLTKLVVCDDVILPVVKVVARLLTDNLGVVVAHDVDNDLAIYSPTS